MYRHRAALLGLLLGATPGVGAYELAGYQWSQASTTFNVDLEGSAPTGISWNAAFTSAANSWTNSSSFTYNVVNSGGDPCRTPTGRGDINAVAFAPDKCGTAFGSTTLAVARNWSTGGELIQSGIIFNTSNVNWNVYSGPWRGTSNADFRRVAVHELGHALGLAHSSGGIMSPFAGSTENPQSDDIAGVAALYGGEGGSGDDEGGSGGDGGGDSGGSGESGGSGGSSGGSGGSGGTTRPAPQPRSDTIFAADFESDSALRSKSLVAAEGGTVVAYDPDAQRILVYQGDEGQLRAVTVAGSGRVSLVRGDFDGDGRVDVGTFRALDGLWTIYPGNGNAFWQFRLGGPGDVPAVADYNGDGRDDLAVWQPATGEWAIKLGSVDDIFRFSLGSHETDVPVPADYDGDRIAEPAVWSGAEGQWRILDLATGQGRAYHLPFEAAVKLRAVPGDYDGDGRADPALFDDVTGTWTVRASRWAETQIVQHPPAANSVPVPADYDGDGITDRAWWADGQLTVELSVSGRQLTRPLRGAMPLTGRTAPVDTDRSAALHNHE